MRLRARAPAAAHDSIRYAEQEPLPTPSAPVASFRARCMQFAPTTPLDPSVPRGSLSLYRQLGFTFTEHRALLPSVEQVVAEMNAKCAKLFRQKRDIIRVAVAAESLNVRDPDICVGQADRWPAPSPPRHELRRSRDEAIASATHSSGWQICGYWRRLNPDLEPWSAAGPSSH